MDHTTQYMNTCAGYQNPNTKPVSYYYSVPKFGGGAQYIEERRKEKGMSIEELCEKAFITTQCYGQCKSRDSFTKDVAIAIANAFDYSLTDTIILLSETRHNFDPHNASDYTVMRCIEAGIHDPEAINDQLVQNGHAKRFNKSERYQKNKK